MFVKVNRICRDGSVVECHVRNTDIRAVEKSDRDGKTTVIRTRFGMLAVTDPIEDVVSRWHDAEFGSKPEIKTKILLDY